MIRLETVENDFPHTGVIKYVLFADTKAEVPSTGAATHCVNCPDIVVTPGSVVYTADYKVAILNSSDNWCWRN